MEPIKWAQHSLSSLTQYEKEVGAVVLHVRYDGDAIISSKESWARAGISSFEVSGLSKYEVWLKIYGFIGELFLSSQTLGIKGELCGTFGEYNTISADGPPVYEMYLNLMFWESVGPFEGVISDEDAVKLGLPIYWDPSDPKGINHPMSEEVRGGLSV